MSYCLFSGDSYDTPEGFRTSLLFRLTGKSRWFFYLKNFAIFSKSGRLGKSGKLNKDNQIIQSNKNFRLVESCGCKIHLRGLENLKAVSNEPVVLIGNHMSLLETAIFHAIVREYIDFTFVIKKGLLKVPFFKHIMLSLKAIAIGRDNPRDDLRAVLGEGKKLLQAGRSIIIFPQSTRSEEFHAEKFNSIGLKLAKSANVRVIPFALKTDFLANGKVFRDLGPIHPENDVWFEFLPAQEVIDNGQENRKEIVEFIQSRLLAWKK